MTDVVWSTAAEQVVIQRTAPRHVTVLRVRKPTDAAIRTIEAELGVTLAREPNERSGGADSAALWLAPGEWMIVGDHSQPSKDGLAQVSGAVHLADVTDGRISYRVSGAHAEDLLAKGCTLDFHASVFGAGRCAQSAFAQVFAVVERRDETSGFVVHADASFTQYLDLWFEDAIIEFRQKDAR